MPLRNALLQLHQQVNRFPEYVKITGAVGCAKNFQPKNHPLVAFHLLQNRTNMQILCSFLANATQNYESKDKMPAALTVGVNCIN